MATKKLKFSKDFDKVAEKIFVDRAKVNKRKVLFNKAMIEGWSYTKFKQRAKKL